MVLENDLDKLLEVKKLYYRNSDIHQNHKKLMKESLVRDFLERDEKKLLYREVYSTSTLIVDE